jgi:hypothetical protein
MLITYAMTLGSEIAIGDQRRIIPSIHRAGSGFKEAWGVHSRQPLSRQLASRFE